MNPIDTPEQTKRDVDLIEYSQRLHDVRRFFHQRYFEGETADAEYASRIEPSPRLETVSEHSWHVADSALILAPRFPPVDLGRAVLLAVLHDKLELYIGDIDPIGRDGTGRKSHAFNESARDRKAALEREALQRYLASLPLETRSVQEALLNEAMECRTDEARFVKSIDKLVALVFVLRKKAGSYKDKHLRLLLNLTERNSQFFPALAGHHWEVFDRIAVSAAKLRNAPLSEIYTISAVDQQMQLF
jgi:5'-deoxynucleotidase YfbR-like HD superfamily hydrolase